MDRFAQNFSISLEAFAEDALGIHPYRYRGGRVMGFVIGIVIVSGLVIAIGFAPAKKDYRTLTCDFD
jgi:hypothetical protein